MKKILITMVVALGLLMTLTGCESEKRSGIVAYDAGLYSFEYVDEWDFQILFPNSDVPIYVLVPNSVTDNPALNNLNIQASMTLGVEQVMDLYAASNPFNVEDIEIDGHSGYKYDLKGENSGLILHNYTIGIEDNSSVTIKTYTDQFLDEYEDVIYSIKF